MIQEETGAAPEAGLASTFLMALFDSHAWCLRNARGGSEERETPAQLNFHGQSLVDWRVEQWQEGVVEVIAEGWTRAD